MKISIYNASSYRPNSIGTIYYLRNPLDYEIFYVGKTEQGIKYRLGGHISDKHNESKYKLIREIIDAGKRPMIIPIEEIHIRTNYDRYWYDIREYYWIKYYLEYGWNLLNIELYNQTQSECNYNKLLKLISEGQLDVSDFYYKLDHKGFPIYDLKKINELGFRFSDEAFAAHWQYLINPENYSHIKESEYDYVYSDIDCNENKNKYHYDFWDKEVPSDIKYKRWH